jgi:hypothetical protein
MKKYLAVFCVIFILIIAPSLVFGQSAKEAVVAFKKLQNKIETGISYRDYSPAVADAKFPAKLFLESAEAKKEPDLAESLSKIANHYDSAIAVWEYKFSGDRDCPSGWICEPILSNVKKIYPDAPSHIAGYTRKPYMEISEVLLFIWGKASDELKMASNLLQNVEAKTEAAKSEIENLRKDNEVLKMEAVTSRKEIEALKKENDKLKDENENLKSKISTLSKENK